MSQAQLNMFPTDPPKPQRERARFIRHPKSWDEVAIEPCPELARMVRRKLGLEP